MLCEFEVYFRYKKLENLYAKPSRTLNSAHIIKCMQKIPKLRTFELCVTRSEDNRTPIGSNVGEGAEAYKKCQWHKKDCTLLISRRARPLPLPYCCKLGSGCPRSGSRTIQDFAILGFCAYIFYMSVKVR